MTNKPAASMWLVVSPEYGTVIPVCDDGTGPMEYGAATIYIEAATKHDAILLGVKAMKARGDDWLADAECPYTGVTAEPVPPCSHGGISWECVECEKVGFDLFYGREGDDLYADR